MTLFGDQAESELERAGELVEQTIEALGVDPAAARLAGTARRWSLRRGSASILIALSEPTEHAPEGTIRVVAPVVRLPAEDRQPKLFRHLLEANASEIPGAAFAIRGDDVVLVAERSVRDLDASEVDAMVRTVGREADRYDDALAEEFGTTRSSDS